MRRPYNNGLPAAVAAAPQRNVLAELPPGTGIMPQLMC